MRPGDLVVPGDNGYVDVYTSATRNNGLRDLIDWIDKEIGLVLERGNSGVVVYRILWSGGLVGWSYDYVLLPLGQRPDTV